MLNVKRTFFLSEEEAKQISDGYITHKLPHYELEDGTIFYGKLGYPADGTNWWAKKIHRATPSSE